MRCSFLVSALVGVAFAQYPTQGETTVLVTTTEAITLATTTVLVTVTSIANVSTASVSEFVPIPSTGPFPSQPTIPEAKTTFPVASSYTGNGTASSSVTAGLSNGTVILTSTVSETAESTVIITSAHSKSQPAETTSATTTASTAGTGDFAKPGALLMVAGMVAAFV